MRDDRRADKLYDEAVDIIMAGTDPRRALDLLWELVKKYPYTSTVHNVGLEQLISHCELNGYWDDGIEACLLAAKLRLQYADVYRARAQACRLSKEGKLVEAAEVRFEAETKNATWHGVIHGWGDKFAHLGAHDRAWELYNRAILMAAEECYSPHLIRQSMANLLLEENKPTRAVEILIQGVCEAEQLARKGAPKSLTAAIRKAIRAAGLKERGLAERIVSACKTEGKESALQMFREELTE